MSAVGERYAESLFDLAIEEKKSIDYIELLKKLKESGYDINKIKYYDKVKITKNNHEFKLEIINENDPLYNQPNLILIGPHVLSFKKGKKFQYSGPTDLSSDEITRLQNIGLVILTDHVLYPQSFNDYFIIKREVEEMFKFLRNTIKHSWSNYIHFYFGFNENSKNENIDGAMYKIRDIEIEIVNAKTGEKYIIIMITSIIRGKWYENP